MFAPLLLVFLQSTSDLPRVNAFGLAGASGSGAPVEAVGEAAGDAAGDAAGEGAFAWASAGGVSLACAVGNNNQLTPVNNGKSSIK